MFDTSDMTQAPNKLLIISPQTYKDVVLCGLKVMKIMGKICVETQHCRNFMYADHVRLRVKQCLSIRAVEKHAERRYKTESSVLS